MSPQKYCQDKVCRPGSSLYYSLRLLDATRREAAIALYAYRQEVAEVIQECSDPQVARSKLAWWRHEVEALYQGQTRHPVTQALAPVVQSLDLPREQVLEFIDGIEMDLDINRYRTFKELTLYCYRTTGIITQLAAQIYGYQDHSTQKFAHELGTALELLDLLWRLRRDLAQNRIYLPEEDLRQFALNEAQLLHLEPSTQLTALLAFELQRIDAHLERAMRLLPEVDRFRQLPHLIMAKLQRALLQEIADSGWPVLTQQTTLTPLRKLWIAWRSAGVEKRRHQTFIRQQQRTA